MVEVTLYSVLACVCLFYCNSYGFPILILFMWSFFRKLTSEFPRLWKLPLQSVPKGASAKDRVKGQALARLQDQNEHKSSHDCALPRLFGAFLTCEWRDSTGTQKAHTQQLSLKLTFWQSKELFNIRKHLCELCSLLKYHHCIYFHKVNFF